MTDKTDKEAETQKQLRRMVNDLETIRTRLQEVVALLAGAKEDSVFEEDDEPDVTTEVRSVVECVLTDQIRPAIRDLTAAAEYRPKRRGGG